jgi:hypothetical protein
MIVRFAVIVENEMAGEADDHLDPRAYEQLRRATATHREELVLRLCGEAGLRAGELARLRPADVTERDEQQGCFVTVREADDGKRTAYLPAGVAHDFRQYVRSNGIGSDESVFGVSERRLQMLVDEVGERAAERTGNAALSAVTPTTLRRFFARRLLVEHGVDARVVTAVGGWEGVDSLLAGAGEAGQSAIAAAFDRVEAGETAGGRLRQAVAALDAVGEQIADQQSRDAVERGVCEALAPEQYAAAWIVDRDPRRDRITVREHAGESPDRFEGAGDTGLIRRALDAGRTLVAPDDPGPGSDTEGEGLLAAVPLADGETGYGALVVRAGEAAFDEPERSVLAVIGRHVAVTITALERKHLLLGGTVLDVQFDYDDDTPLVALSRALGRPLALDGVVAGERGLLCFLRVPGAGAQETLGAAGEVEGLDDVRLLSSDDDGVTVELLLAEDSPLLVLTQRGATITDLTVDGEATVTCELSPEADLRSLHDDLRGRFPSIELRSKRERHVSREDPGPRGSLSEQVTDKQRSVLLAAYHAGYFEWPRESTAEDLAESMDVSSPTFHNHLRKAQQAIFAEILDEESRSGQ